MSIVPFPLWLLLSSAGTPARLPIDIVFEGRPIRHRVESVAMDEVTSIWARYAVDVRAASLDAPGRDDAVRLSVVVVDHHPPRQSPDVLGSILLRGESPAPVIQLYSDSIVQLVARCPLPGWALEDASPVRDLVEGRVLGRALAHEIGHYLLRLPGHSPAGLMRARQPAADLIGADDRKFTLSGDDLIRLDSVLSVGRRPLQR